MPQTTTVIIARQHLEDQEMVCVVGLIDDQNKLKYCIDVLSASQEHPNIILMGPKKDVLLWSESSITLKITGPFWSRCLLRWPQQ